MAKTSVNALRTSMPSACTIALFSTPARMISPYRVLRRKSCSSPSTTAAVAISTQRSFGMRAPATVVVSCSQGGTTNDFASGPQMPTSSATNASWRPTDEHLVDVAVVEGTDQDELDERREYPADHE